MQENKASDKQIREFVQMLESHLARLIYAAQEHLKGLTRGEWDRAVGDTIALAWRSRESIDLTKQSLPLWFGELALIARTSNVDRSDEEVHVLSELGKSAPSVQTPGFTTADFGHTFIEPPQQAGKECPPCWRCLYHQGWLPMQKVVHKAYDDTDVADICKDVDERKIKIAYYVRGEYDPDLLEHVETAINTY